MISDFANQPDGPIQPIHEPEDEDSLETAKLESEAEEARAKAFVDGGFFSLFDKNLYPYSSGRRSLFEEIRMAVGSPPFREVLKRVEQTGEPSAFLPDAARILWLCSLDFEVIAKARLRCGSLVKLQTEIDTWLDENLQDVTAQRSACALALQIYNESGVNQAEVAPRKGGVSNSKGGDSVSLGELRSRIGNPSTLSLSQRLQVGQKTTSVGDSLLRVGGPITTAPDSQTETPCDGPTDD